MNKKRYFIRVEFSQDEIEEVTKVFGKKSVRQNRLRALIRAAVHDIEAARNMVAASGQYEASVWDLDAEKKQAARRWYDERAGDLALARGRGRWAYELLLPAKNPNSNDVPQRIAEKAWLMLRLGHAANLASQDARAWAYRLFAEDKPQLARKWLRTAKGFCLSAQGHHKVALEELKTLEHPEQQTALYNVWASKMAEIAIDIENSLDSKTVHESKTSDWRDWCFAVFETRKYKAPKAFETQEVQEALKGIRPSLRRRLSQEHPSWDVDFVPLMVWNPKVAKAIAGSNAGLPDFIKFNDEDEE